MKTSIYFRDKSVINACFFDSYGNQNYEETVLKALNNFFLHYDWQYDPCNSIITCDYPTATSVYDTKITGIDRIYNYVSFICVEQRFMAIFPREKVIDLLYRYDSDYNEQFINVAIPIMRHIIGHMFISAEKRNDIKEKGAKENYRLFYEKICELTEEKLTESFLKLLKEFTSHHFTDDIEIYNYFAGDMKNFAVMVKNVKNMEYIKNVIVL